MSSSEAPPPGGPAPEPAANAPPPDASPPDAPPAHAPEAAAAPLAAAPPPDGSPLAEPQAPAPAPRLRVRERPLGQTGLDVTELSLGTWGLSGDGYGPVARSEAEAVVRRAVELGVGLFETSDSYARGAMEELLGRLLEPHAESTVIATRHGVDRSQQPARKRFSPDYLEKALEASLARLRRKSIDVYLLHNPTVEALERVELLQLLKGLREQGKIRAWGVSAGNIDVARAAMEAGAEVLELPYNGLFCADMHALAGDIASRRVGVLAHSVLGYGLLAGLWPETKQFQPGDHRKDRWQGFELSSRIKQLDALRTLQGGDVYTLRSAALRFVLANHLVSSAVLGPRTVAQLEQLVREAGKGPPYLDDEKLSRLPARLSALGVDI